MHIEKSCGGIVFRRFHGNLEVLIIQHANGGHWSFPKGHVEQGESEMQTAQREIKEETGIDVVIDPSFRDMITYYPRRDIKKEVVYFLARAKNVDLVPQPEEIATARWIQIELANQVLTYEKDRLLLKKAKPLLKSTI